MVRMMDIPDPRGRGSFWEAYRACVEENRVRPDRSPFYVSWAKDFANFLPEKPFPDHFDFCVITGVLGALEFKHFYLEFDSALKFVLFHL